MATAVFIIAFPITGQLCGLPGVVTWPPWPPVATCGLAKVSCLAWSPRCSGHSPLWRWLDVFFWVLRGFLYILVEGLFWDRGRLSMEDTLNSIILDWIKHICCA